MRSPVPYRHLNCCGQRQRTTTLRLVNIDMKMSGMNGIELVQRIKPDPVVAQIPPVLLTRLWLSLRYRPNFLLPISC